VYKYGELNPDELKQAIEELKTRQKKLDCVGGVILSWLSAYSGLSGPQFWRYSDPKKLGAVVYFTKTKMLRMLRGQVR